MLKKFLALIITLSMLLCVCGCNNNPKASSSEIIEYIYEVETEYDESFSSEDNHEQTVTTDPSSSSTPSKTIDYDTIVEVDLCDEIVRSYLSAQATKQQYSLLKEYSGSRHDNQNLNLFWSYDGSSKYTVYVSENADFSNSYITQLKSTSLNAGVCTPGKIYYWKVMGEVSSEPIAGGKIKINDAPARFVDINGVGNVRDLGGWTTEGGKTVSYGKIYRGRRLDDITTQGIEALKYLGMKTEIDMRSSNNDPGETEGTDLKYYFMDAGYQYDRILSSGYAQDVRNDFKQIFALLADENNYPFYIHCNAGADRTGTLAFLINGYLGVSYADLTRDFELTSFSQSGKRWRGEGNGSTFLDGDTIMQYDEKNYVAWGELYNRIMNEHGTGDGKLSSAIESFLVDYVGVEKSHLESMKQIMLG